MFRMVVYYRPPEDLEAFEQGYVEAHLPLVQAYDNISSYSFTRMGRRIAGEVPFSHMFIAEWADKDAWKADMASPAAKAAMEDAATRAPQGFDVVVLDEIAGWKQS